MELKPQRMLTVKFTCYGCGLVDVDCPVRVSRKPGEDLDYWMKKVLQPCLGNKHADRSPTCKHGVCGIKIPIGKDGSNSVGRVGEIPEGME